MSWLDQVTNGHSVTLIFGVIAGMIYHALLL